MNQQEQPHSGPCRLYSKVAGLLQEIRVARMTLPGGLVATSLCGWDSIMCACERAEEWAKSKGLVGEDEVEGDAGWPAVPSCPHWQSFIHPFSGLEMVSPGVHMGEGKTPVLVLSLPLGDAEAESSRFSFLGLCELLALSAHASTPQIMGPRVVKI